MPPSRPAAALLLLFSVVVACGKKAPPLPPEPRGPNFPREVRVRQIGEVPHVVFDLPSPRGGKPVQEMVRVELLRVLYESETAPPPDPDAFRRRGDVVRVEYADPFAPGAVVGLSDPTVVELDGRGVGKIFRYAVRVLDRRDRPSAWVAVPDLVLLAAGNPPAGLSAEPTAMGVRLRWEGNAENGYNIYRSEGDAAASIAINDQPIRANEYLDEDIRMGRRYNYRVRALLADGRPRRETVDSPPVDVTAVDKFAPESPRGLVAVQEGAGVRLFWDPSPERDVIGYRVSRSIDGAAFVPIGPDPLERPLFLDTEVRPGQRVRYRVTALDAAEPTNESAPAATEPLTMIGEPVDDPV